jgi:hypothetical protein
MPITVRSLYDTLFFFHELFNYAFGIETMRCQIAAWQMNDEVEIEIWEETVEA